MAKKKLTTFTEVPGTPFFGFVVVFFSGITHCAGNSAAYFGSGTVVSVLGKFGGLSKFLYTVVWL